MAILFTANDYTREALAQKVVTAMAGHDVRVWPAIGDRETIDYIIATGTAPTEHFQGLPNLKAIFLAAAGVDAILKDPDLPNVPLIRCVNDSLSQGMAGHVAYHVLKFHRHYHRYEQQQRDQVWKQLRQPAAAAYTIGFMGMGEMAQACMTVLKPFGYRLRGWSRTPKQVADIEHFAGDDALPSFLNGCQIVVCLLPLTDATRGILCADHLQHLPQGSYLISAGRGDHMVANDILHLLRNGHLAAAALDVFATEPLPADHPFWSEPNVVLTPHIASITDFSVLCADIRQQIAAHENGQPFRHVVDRDRGY